MFTGIIEEIGKIQQFQMGAHSGKITIEAKRVLEDVSIGDSIAVNGVCLTVTKFTHHSFTVDVMHETVRRSSLGTCETGSLVNLERAMAANGRYGGHIVSGHVDGTGVITAIRQDENAFWYTIEADQELIRGMVPKGSITIDGISLTIAELGLNSFQVSIIPHTRKETILSYKKIGDKVNLETDILGKYVKRFLENQMDLQGGHANRKGRGQSGITESFLLENGF